MGHMTVSISSLNTKNIISKNPLVIDQSKSPLLYKIKTVHQRSSIRVKKTEGVSKQYNEIHKTHAIKFIAYSFTLSHYDEQKCSIR